MGHSDNSANSALSGTDGPAGGPKGAEPVSPVRAFLLLLALLVLSGVVLWATTRPDRAEPIRMERPEPSGANPDRQAQPESRPDQRPTKAEAKKIFRGLRHRAYRAIETKNLKVLHRIYTTHGPLLPRVMRQVRSLIRDDVVARSHARLLLLRVLVRTRSTIDIRSKTRFFPCFTDATGRNVTVDRSNFEETATWTLKEQGKAWRIHDHIQNNYKRVNGDAPPCP